MTTPESNKELLKRFIQAVKRFQSTQQTAEFNLWGFHQQEAKALRALVLERMQEPK